MDRLEKGLFDFGIVFEPHKLKSYEYLTLPLVNYWGIITRKDNPLVKKEKVTLQDLHDEPLFVSRQMLENEDLVEWWGEEIPNLKIKGTFNLVYNASVMARMGVESVLSLNRLILSSEESEMVYRPLDPPVIGMSYVVWKKGRAMSHVSQLFLEELKKCIANHSGEFMEY